MPQKRKGIRLWLRKEKGREAVWVIRDGKSQVRTGCLEGDLERAEKELADYITKNWRPDTSKRSLAAVRIEEVLALYALDQPVDKPSRKLIGYHIDNLTPFWGDKTLADVKGSTCRKYLEHRTSPSLWTSSSEVKRRKPQSIKSSTVRRELKTLQAAINHWHKESPLEAVPKVSLPPEGERRERVLSRSEVAKLLWACRKRKAPHVARFILIGLYTGTRHQAILKLRWSPALHGGHIDLERGVIYRRGSAEKETSKRRPPVGIPKRLDAFLARWRASDRDNASVIRHDGASILKMKRAWKGVVKAAGLGPDVTPHVLRHTAATWLLWSGKDIWEVGGIIGADASTVERVYGHHRLAVEERARA